MNSRKMSAEVKKLWVEALRSGEYKQGRDFLRTTDGGFCCLGVLCDLHAKATGNSWGILHQNTGSYLDFDTELPDEVMTWAGLQINWGAKVVIDGQDTMLPIHNDGSDGSIITLEISPKSFLQIADAIEEQL